jgi:hypothetical protein
MCAERERIVGARERIVVGLVRYQCDCKRTMREQFAGTGAMRAGMIDLFITYHSVSCSMSLKTRDDNGNTRIDRI